MLRAAGEQAPYLRTDSPLQERRPSNRRRFRLTRMSIATPVVAPAPRPPDRTGLGTRAQQRRGVLYRGSRAGQQADEDVGARGAAHPLWPRVSI